jgi:hypothetical protein
LCVFILLVVSLINSQDLFEVGTPDFTASVAATQNILAYPLKIPGLFLTLSNPIFLPTAYSPALIYLHPSSLPFSYKHKRANTTHNHLFTSKHMAC